MFLANDFVSVSKADDTDWNMLKPMVMAALMEHLSMGQPILIEAEAEDDGADEQPKHHAQPDASGLQRRRNVGLLAVNEKQPREGQQENPHL